jgi:hypothetical protein
MPAKKRTLVSLKSIFRPDMPSGGRLKPILGDDSDVRDSTMNNRRRNILFSEFMHKLGIALLSKSVLIWS